MIDVHAHLNFSEFQNDYVQVIERSFNNGIKAVINVGSDLKTSQKAIKIAKEFKNCYASIGLHPIHVQDEDFNINEYKTLIKENLNEVKAVGETGLDFFYNLKNKNQQKEIFLKHLELAKEFNLPVIFHCRGEKENPEQVYLELLDIIKNFDFKLRGEIHCFSTNWSIAQKFLELGFYLGFTGVITFLNVNQELIEVVKKTPSERILIETDCPFLAPLPFRGQRAEPWHVKYVALKIAELKNLSFENVIEKTTLNAIKLFNLQV
jgi:TatD DNase family protein